MLLGIVIKENWTHLKKANIASIYICHVSKTQTLDLRYHTKLLHIMEWRMDEVWEGIYQYKAFDPPQETSRGTLLPNST